MVKISNQLSIHFIGLCHKIMELLDYIFYLPYQKTFYQIHPQSTRLHDPEHPSYYEQEFYEVHNLMACSAQLSQELSSSSSKQYTLNEHALSSICLNSSHLNFIRDFMSESLELLICYLRLLEEQENKQHLTKNKQMQIFFLKQKAQQLLLNIKNKTLEQKFYQKELFLKNQSEMKKNLLAAGEKSTTIKERFFFEKSIASKKFSPLLEQVRQFKPLVQSYRLHHLTYLKQQGFMGDHAKAFYLFMHYALIKNEHQKYLQKNSAFFIPLHLKNISLVLYHYFWFFHSLSKSLYWKNYLHRSGWDLKDCPYQDNCKDFKKNLDPFSLYPKIFNKICYEPLLEKKRQLFLLSTDCTLLKPMAQEIFFLYEKALPSVHHSAHHFLRAISHLVI